MSTFLAYNTDDPNATAQGYTLLSGNGTATVGPVQTGVASRVAGAVFADVSGSCQVQQSFDFWLPGNQVNPTPHWDGVDTITVTGGTPAKIDVDVIAPVLQVTYTNGASPQNHFRLFIRVFGNARN